MKLFPFTMSEANLLSVLLERALSQVTSQNIGESRQFVSADLMRVASIIESGGLDVYVGSVTDQDGDSSWELTSNLQKIQSWARDMATVSFEVPRTYRVSVKRFGFGAAEKL